MLPSINPFLLSTMASIRACWAWALTSRWPVSSSCCWMTYPGIMESWASNCWRRAFILVVRRSTRSLDGLELGVEGPAAFGLVPVHITRDQRAVRRDARHDAPARGGPGAGRQAGGLGLFRDGLRLDVLAFARDGLAADLLGDRDLDGRGLLDLQEIGVPDDDGMPAFEALPAGFLALGQLGQALGAERRGQSQYDDESIKISSLAISSPLWSPARRLSNAADGGPVQSYQMIL